MIERRDLHGEVRAAEEEGRLEGIGLRYGSLSVDMGGWFEEFLPDAFADSLGEDDIRVIWQHDNRHVFGRVQSGTARVWSDTDALRYSAEPPDAQWARDAMESIRRGDVNQNSFGFTVPEGGDTVEERDGRTVRIVKRARLVEVGPQTRPAYEDTSVIVRSLPETTLRLLKSQGLGVDLATRILTGRRMAV